MSNPSPSTRELLAHAAWVRTLALELVRDAGLAEDLAQETLLRTLQHPPRDLGALRGFLWRVLHNTWREERRSLSRRRARELRAAQPEAQSGPDALAERLSTHRRVVEAVERLEEPFRSAIVLRFFEELPQREIAQRLGVPVKTVASRLQRGLARLRVDLDEQTGARRTWAVALLALIPTEAAELELRPVLPRWALLSGGVALAVVIGTALFTRGAPRSAPRPTAAARADMHVAEAADLVRRVEARPPRLALARTEPKELRGTVVDLAGAPLAGARVEALEEPLAGFEVRVPEFVGLARSAAVTETDAEGHFALELPAGQVFSVRAAAAGFGTERRENARAGDTLAFVLAAAGTLEIRAWRGDDPADRAAIVLYLQSVAEPVWRGTTDEHGRVVAQGLTPGIYVVESSPWDGSRTFRLDVALAPGATASVELRSEAGAVLSGRIVAAGSRLPVARARVTGSRATQVESDAQGAFELRGLPLDPNNSSAWTLSVQAQGFAPRGMRVAATAASEEELSIELEPEARLTGLVVDELGAPVPLAWIACGDRGGRSDDAGRFEVRGLASAVPLTVWIRAPGYGTWTGALAEGIWGEHADIGRIVLQAGLSIVGRTLTSAGEPIEGASVELQRLSLPNALLGSTPVSPSGPGQELSVMVRKQAVAGPAPVLGQGVLTSELERCGRRRTQTGAEGAFCLDDLLPGSYQILARKNGFEATQQDSFELAEGFPALELVFATGLELAGRVKGSDGVALANAWLLVSAAGAQGSGPVQLSALDGTFALRGVPGGAVDLEVSYHGTEADGEYRYLGTRVRGLVAPRVGLDIVLPRNLPIEGLILGEQGEPLTGIWVRAGDADGRITTALPDADGHFRVAAAEGSSVDLDLGIQIAPPGESPPLPRYAAELHAVPAGSAGVVLQARRER